MSISNLTTTSNNLAPSTSNLNINNLNVESNAVVYGNLQINGTLNLDNIDLTNITCNQIQFTGVNQTPLSKYNVYSQISLNVQIGGGVIDTIQCYGIKIGRLAMILVSSFSLLSGSTSTNSFSLIGSPTQMADFAPYVPQSPSTTPGCICGNVYIYDPKASINRQCFIVCGPTTGVYTIQTIDDSEFSVSSTIQSTENFTLTYITQS